MIRRAEKPSSSRRNSLRSWDAGAVNSWSRKADAASSQKRRPWPAMRHVGVRGVVAAALGQVARHDPHDRQQQQATPP